MFPVRREKACEIMRGAGWLSLMPPAFGDEVLSRSTLRSFSAGEAVFRAGDPVGGIFGLVSGAVSVNSAMPGALPQLIHLGLPGAWTGEGCFMTGQPRRGELRALGDIQMMHLSLAIMEEMAARDGRAIRAFGTISLLGVDLLIRVIHDLQKAGPGRRIASVLHRMSHEGSRPVPLTQEQIAEASGTSRKVVNAWLRRFSERDWIARPTGYRFVTVKDNNALASFAENTGPGV